MNEDLLAEVLRTYVRLKTEGKFIEAMYHIDKSLLEFPDDPRLWFILGELKAQRGEGSTAIGCYNIAMALDKRYVVYDFPDKLSILRKAVVLELEGVPDGPSAQEAPVGV